MTEQEFISNKIGQLIREGYKKDQAAAIAYSMYNSGKHMQKAQQGVQVFDPNKPTQRDLDMYNAQQAMPQQGIMLDPNNMTQEGFIPDAELLNRARYNKFINSQQDYSGSDNYDENGNAKDTSNAYQDYTRLHIANPYTGVDPMARLYWSGQQFGKGNTAGGILGAVGGGLGIARTFMSGLGAGKENQRQEEDMRYQLYGKQPNYEYGQVGNNGTYVYQEGGTKTDSIAHQAKKILKYEQARGGSGGTPLAGYSNPQYMKMLMEGVYPEVQKIMPNASAMEIGEAMDFVFNAGWDKSNNKITKDPRAYALQEYYRQYDKSKLDAEGKWPGRKNAPYSFDQEYNNTVGKLSENERRVLMNKGRDWYYKNTNNPSPGVPSSDYNDTWYGRIWNTNDYNEFNPNNPKFTPKKQEGGKITNADMMSGMFTTDMQNPNIEVEDGEHLKNSQTGAITQAVGKTHEKGGIPVNLPDNSKVLSDFTKIGAENAKKFQKQFDIAFKASHTFADVMDKVNDKIGLNKLIEEEKEYTTKIEKQLKSSIDEATKKVNLNFLSKEMEKLQKQKEMLQPIQDKIFEEVFKAQEQIPKKSDGYTLLKQEGGDVQAEQQISPEQIITAFSQMTGQDPQEIIAQLQQMQPEEQAQALQQMVATLQQNPQEEQMEGQMSNPQEEGQEIPIAQVGGYTQAQRDARFEDFYKNITNLGYTGKKQIGEMQTWMAKNYPDDVAKYFNENGQPLTAKHVDIIKSKYKDAFQKAGIPSTKPSAQYTQEEKAKLKEALGEKADKNFLLEGFQDNKWDWRYPQVSAQKDNTSTVDNSIKAPLMQKTVSGEPILTPEDTYQSTEQQALRPRGVDKTVMAQIPSNFILPPDSLRGVYKPSINLSRLDPIKVSPESNLAAIEGQRQATADSLAFLPENQRAALLANMLGTTQASANQAIGATTQANTAQQAQTDAYNASQGDKEQLTNINLAKDYEAKMYGAIRNTDIDLRSYYDQLNRENRQKFLDVSTLNMLNQVTPNYQSDGANIYFNQASPNLSNPQVDPYLMQMYESTKNDPAARMKFLNDYYKTKQA